MVKKTLAFKLKPQLIKDIIGQTHLINHKTGIITKMIKKQFVPSLIFYGKPGIGKSSLAYVLAQELKLKFSIFNASLDKKHDLETIVSNASKHKTQVIILEEIHRLNKDKQDILLKGVEEGYLIMFACTTENPYFVINPALRSRSQMIKLEPISQQEMTQGLKDLIQRKKIPLKISLNQLNLISQLVNGDVRMAFNCLEILINLYNDKKITNDLIKNIMNQSNNTHDKNGDEHYDLLSALQKSVRGSDVDASLHYLARLANGGDFQALTRRMLIMAYEDIGLANPILGVKVKSAIDSFFQIGMPEGIIPLGLVITEMALSEKSNTAYLATMKALNDVKNNGKAFQVPSHLKDSHYSGSKDLNHGKRYKYPHDYPLHYIQQQYLPDQIKNIKYYQGKTHNLYEKKLLEIYQKFKTK